ncbi:hypothetical protein XENOCAPTIV_021662 [Xenoophorus captivus]|uniref:G-protein coupled receptors family 2 profile 2 domain-containing protein n=1 Tax=Xenoophorus captivus TaxID=1517983 RepID=A0ABV0Q5Q4_9TELE
MPMAWSALTGPCVALILLFFGLTSCTPSGPASATCATLEQSRFFGVFSSTTTLPSSPCSWTLQNPDPRRYNVYMKITKPTDSCVPRQIKTFQFDSFIETSRTYLGMESFDEVVRLCDASTTVTYLESSKQFLQIRKVAPRNAQEVAGEEHGVGEFKAEFLVVGKRNPSMPACQMLCQWLDKCLNSSTHDYPCGIMNTPCQCWEAPKRKPGSCYRGGVYVEKCTPVSKDNGRDAEIIKCLLSSQQMQKQTSGPPGAHVPSPVGKAGKAVPASVPLLPSPPSVQDPCVRIDHATIQLSALWMVLGMSGPPGACALPHAAVVTGTVPAPASSPRMEDSLAAAPRDKPSSATLLSAQGTVNETCLSWDESESAVPVHSHRTKCVCDSLSTFAILARVNFDSVIMVHLLPCSPPGVEEKLQVGIKILRTCQTGKQKQRLLTPFFADSKPDHSYIRSERSVILINFCLSIICSNALIFVGQTQARNKVVCTLVAALLHFFFLSSFCWVLTEAWQSYMAVTGRLRNRIIRKRFLASLWSSCVVLPLLALTWMSAVLAITDRRSALFQILFAVFDSLEGFIIVMVHCILRREMPLPMGPNFHTLPSKGSHMQAVPEYSSHTLTLKREKSRLAGGVDPSCGNPVYVCEGELFQQLDADLALAQAEGSLSDSYVLMPNTTSTLRSKPKDDPTKYNISVEQLPQARLMHLGGPFAEPQAAFGMGSILPDQVSVSYSERDSPIQNIHNMSSESHITHSSLENTFESMNSMMSKSETISTLSMSSLEVGRDNYFMRFLKHF